MKRIGIPAELKKMQEIFGRNGRKAYLVGGAVRDMLRGETASDWDIATDARPEEVMAMFRRVVPTGIAHGTVTVAFMGRHVEVTTFRTEKGYADGRHPDAVEFGTDINADLSRRDFTMNAIAASLADGTITDPFGGREDIRRRTIRTVGVPSDRFAEDGLRPIRAVRFAAQLGFAIDAETLSAIPAALERTASVSIERFRDELQKMLASPVPSVALELLESTGILGVFIPELSVCRGVEQADARGFHKFDVLSHLFYACDGAPREKPLVRLAALLHDIGKPATRKEERRDGNRILTFHNHEAESARMCMEITTRLRFPKADCEYASHLVRNHMFHYESSWTDAAVRRFLARVTPQAVEDLLDLRIADVHGMTRTPPRLKDGPWSGNLLELKERIDLATERNSALGIKNLAVNGRDLMAEGIPAGKLLGDILRELLETVLDDPECNTKPRLLEIARKIMRSRGNARQQGKS